MQGIDSAWHSVGVQSHVDKKHDAIPDLEFQGTVLHSQHHYSGVIVLNRVAIFAMIIKHVFERFPLVAEADRVVGEIGFCQTFCPCPRRVFDEIYVWLDLCRSTKYKRFELRPRACI
jgi:hypothetical protein